MRRVVKFGGTSIATPAMVREGARHIAQLVEYGEQIAVVVSAPGNSTSELLDTIYQVSGQGAGYSESCEFASLGEEKSVQMMVAALKSYGVQAHPFMPKHADNWPIIADSEDDSPISTAKVNEERPFRLRTQQTVNRFRRFVLPKMRVGAVPVIAGFFAIDSAGHIISLGRGGSDITAFIVANQVTASEVVIVTDVKGVLSADPRLTENPKLLEKLSAEDMQVISTSGSRVLHPRALKYMGDNMLVRLMDYRELDQLEKTGTSVLGRSQATLFRNPVELSMLTIVGEVGQLEALQGLLLTWCRECQVRSAATSSSNRYICYYIPSELAEEAYARLHSMINEAGADFTNISLRGGVGEIRLRSAKFIDEPGVLADVTGVLANSRINIIELVSGLTDISVFINYQDMDQAESLLSRVLEQFQG